MWEKSAINNYLCPGAALGFSRGGGEEGFSKKLENLVDFFRSTKLISKVSKITIKTQFWANVLRRRQVFEKKNRAKRRFRLFLEKFDQKIAFFFGTRSPLKIKIFWCQKRL